MKNSAGFSLIELLITITIMAIVISASTLSFNTWTRKSTIEKQTRELYTDLSEARSNAFTQKKVYGIVLQPTSYAMKTYSSEVEYTSSAAAVAHGVVIANKSLKYSLKTKSGIDMTDTPVVFDTTGFTTSGFLGITAFVGSPTEQAALNCVVVYKSRTNMGKINGTNCEFR